MEQAATSTAERDSLLKDARLCFNRAISLERGCRLAAAWFGLAVCHFALKDQANATAALQEFTRVEPDGPPFIDRVLFTTEPYDTAAQQCRQLQHAARSFLANFEPKAFVALIKRALENRAADPV